MKVLSFFSLTLVLALCTLGCSDRVAEDQFEATPSSTEAVFSVKKPPAYISSVIPKCGKLGPTAKLILTETDHYSLLHIDVYTEGGLFIDRWTRQNPNLLPSQTISIGTPPNGGKDCSAFIAGATYRLAIIYGSDADDPEPELNSPWPHGLWPSPFSSTGEDTLVTISPCSCNSSS